MSDIREIVGAQRAPLIAAPMTDVSGPDLVVTCMSAGIIGSFPTTNARDGVQLREWFAHIDEAVVGDRAYAVNIPLRLAGKRRDDHLDAALSSRCAAVIVSVGSPSGIVAPVHAAGRAVIAVVATAHHARRALDAGADALVLLSAGAGGFTGWMNPFAFVRAVRGMTDAPLVLAGGISDRASLEAALVLGCDAAYLGSPLIAATESLAAGEWRSAVASSAIDDVVLRAMDNGLDSNGVVVGDSFWTMGHSAHSTTAVASAASIIDAVLR
jgi:nitronate monooxygenase